MDYSQEKYNSCDWITSGIEFRQGSVRTCCFGYLQGDEFEDQTNIIKNYNGEKIDWNAFFANKNTRKLLQKSNNPPESCENCIYLSEEYWSDENFIDHITLNHWAKCNCNCSYCYTASDKERFNQEIPYKVYPILKDMFDRNILRATPRCCISFGGGEPTILDEFEDIINLLLEHNFNNIRINSSGIKYSESIEKGLKKGAISLVISPDSGTKETYEKIKQVKTFDKVWDNIKKYSNAQSKNDLVKVKYILIPGTNDNTEEINKWLNLTLKSGAKAIALSVEQAWYQKNLGHFPQWIFDQIKYIEDKSKELNLNLEIYCEALGVLREKK